jgi:hypothetical protein
MPFLLLFVALGRLYREMWKQPETRALLALAVLVLLFGIVFYTVVEQWTVLDAAYFCVVTLGTVGYGDLTPTTSAGKLFTMGYIIVGLSIIGAFFATAGRLIHPERFLESVKTSLERVRHKDESSQTEVDESQ